MTLEEHLDNDTLKRIEDIFHKINTEREFEIMFFRGVGRFTAMNLENFMRIMKYIKKRSVVQKLHMEENITLDIAYHKPNTDETFRITINGTDKINEYMKTLHKRNNHVIFSTFGLLEDDSISYMKKVKDIENMVDVPDFGLRVRLSDELPLDRKKIPKLEVTDRNNVFFRHKHRMSLIVEESKDHIIRVDLTSVKSGKNINIIYQEVPSYELEIELVSKKSSPSKSHLDAMYGETQKFLKIIQQSNFVISKTLENEVLSRYASLLNIDENKMQSLEGRRPQSLEVQHVVDKLPNVYAVTDKADGDRFFLITHNMRVYLISDGLIVKNTGLVFKDKKYDGSILDGEYIFLPSKNRHLFMCFDCLVIGEKNIQHIPSFMERIKSAQEIVNQCFILKGQKGFTLKDYDGPFDANKVVAFHDKQMTQYMQQLNADVEHEKVYPLIRIKYFVPSLGGKSNEIFKYAQLLYEKYMYDREVNCPYILDGLIFQPLDQRYVTSVKETKYLEYKWKPADKNSIDFYIIFDKDLITGKLRNVYDNSSEEFVRGKPYQIVNLFVGKRVGNQLQPVEFNPEESVDKSQAYLFIKDGGVRDIEGNILQDKTVVEFYYNNDSNIPDKYRWVAIRTRYDKTESMRKHKTNYGNYVDVANKVWRSIKNPISENDFKILSNDATFQKHMDMLREKIDHSVILSEMKENAYFQVHTTLAKPMRSFHNWIKSILIYTFCHADYEEGRQLTILDIACGKGQDNMKYYYSKVISYLGIDIDINALMSPIDGAMSRYNQMKKSYPNFPPMAFINADAGALLSFDNQQKALGTMTSENKALIEKYFPKDMNRWTKFDRVSCQFAIHYFLANQIVWDNFLVNLKTALKPGGYFLITTFDADRIVKLLNDTNQYTSYYTNKDGEKKALFEVVKKYEGIKPGDKIGVGTAIDFHNAIDFHEGVYVTEYLVQKDFLVQQLEEHCDLELADTDLFENQFIINRAHFGGPHLAESDERTRKFLSETASFFDQSSEVNKACFDMSRLYRYYAFRRRDFGEKKKIERRGDKKVEELKQKHLKK